MKLKIKNDWVYRGTVKPEKNGDIIIPYELLIDDQDKLKEKGVIKY